MMQVIFMRRLVAGTLLFLFVLSNMPRQTLHSMFANHKDDNCKPIAKADSKVPKLSASGIHCQCLDLVIQNPFVNHSDHIDLAIHFYIKKRVFFYKDTFYPVSINLPSLRGPPSMS
ncbi:MAG: hypothetical protein ABIN36_03575 [Ferruginibacter sp.]